jgi:hypothetical protein
VKSSLNIPTAPPVLDEETFQQLLAAAHILQECSNRRIGESNTTLLAAAVTIRGEPIQDRSLALVSREDPPTDLAVDSTSVDRTDAGPLLPQGDSAIPPEVAHQLSALASQLNAFLESAVQPDSESSQITVLTAAEEASRERQIVANPVRVEAHLEGPVSEPWRFTSLFQFPGLSRTGDSSYGIIARILPSNELFRRTATMFALAAVLALLLGASWLRLSHLPGRLVQSSEDVQQKSLPRTRTLDTAETTKLVPLGVTDRTPPSAMSPPSVQNAVAKSAIVRSTYARDTDLNREQNIKLASEVQNSIRADRRLQMTQVRVRASQGIVTLSGDVASDAERVAAAQDAAHIAGVEALVNALHVPTTNPQGLNGASQKASATIPSVARSLGDGSHTTGSTIPSLSSAPSPISLSETNPSPQASEQIIVPRGTVIVVRLAETLSSAANKPGDTFLTRLASPIVIGDRVVVPEGAVAKGRIVDARNAGRLSGVSTVAVELTHLVYNGRAYELSSSQYSRLGAPRNAYAAAATTGGNGVGAVLGIVIGRRRGAAIGTFLGGAAGSGVQALTKPAAAELPVESTLSLRLERPLKVIPSFATPQVQNAGQGLSQDQPHDRPILKERLGSAPAENTSGSSQKADNHSEESSSQPKPPHD